MAHRDAPGKFFGRAIVSLAILSRALPAQERPVTGPTRHTQIVLLGTGDPVADPDRSGLATAVVVNGTPYLVDFGAGIVRRAKAAVVDKGITALEPTSLQVAFVTHLHSDYTVGYNVEQQSLFLRCFAEGHRVNAHEISAGVVYKDACHRHGVSHEACFVELRISLRYALPPHRHLGRYEPLTSDDRRPPQLNFAGRYSHASPSVRLCAFCARTAGQTGANGAEAVA